MGAPCPGYWGSQGGLCGWRSRVSTDGQTLDRLKTVGAKHYVQGSMGAINYFSSRRQFMWRAVESRHFSRRQLKCLSTKLGI